MLEVRFGMLSPAGHCGTGLSSQLVQKLRQEDHCFRPVCVSELVQGNLSNLVPGREGCDAEWYLSGALRSVPCNQYLLPLGRAQGSCFRIHQWPGLHTAV